MQRKKILFIFTTDASLLEPIKESINSLNLIDLDVELEGLNLDLVEVKNGDDVSLALPLDVRQNICSQLIASRCDSVFLCTSFKPTYVLDSFCKSKLDYYNTDLNYLTIWQEHDGLIDLVDDYLKGNYDLFESFISGSVNETD